jgi:hypothetical protein
MSFQVAVLVIHGMGSQKSDFARAMIEELEERLRRRGKNPAAVAWQAVHWADVIAPRQDAFLQAITTEPANDIDFMRLRHFVISALGDASAYQNIRGRETSTYAAIHEVVRKKLNQLYEETLASAPCPLIIMAHSLGGHILSNYIWDTQHHRPAGLSDFEAFKHLAGMITFGCNLPLFTFAHAPLERFAFPGELLSPQHQSLAEWHNYYDPDDVLGYPLAQLGGDYGAIKDHPINAGGILTSWNPMSHLNYWTDNDFTQPAANYIARFMPDRD